MDARVNALRQSLFKYFKYKIWFGLAGNPLVDACKQHREFAKLRREFGLMREIACRHVVRAG
jgi:hypothetical protein